MTRNTSPKCHAASPPKASSKHYVRVDSALPERPASDYPMRLKLAYKVPSLNTIVGRNHWLLHKGKLAAQSALQSALLAAGLKW